MKSSGNTRTARTVSRIGMLLLFPALGLAQANPAPKPSAAIPATAPTSSVSDLPSARPAMTSAAHGTSKVTWNGTDLTVQANGDSLRNILRDISRQTGMKITGGVPGDPVFGTYGPASAQAIFAELFDGLPINMILINGSPTKPRELQLTARTGAPSSPDTQPITAEAPGTQPPPPQTGATGVSHPPTQASAPQQSPSPDSALPPLPVGLPQDGNGVAPPQNTDSSEQPQSPNGTRTPEQIFEELRRRQQQTSPSQP